MAIAAPSPSSTGVVGQLRRRAILSARRALIVGQRPLQIIPHGDDVDSGAWRELIPVHATNAVFQHNQ